VRLREVASGRVRSGSRLCARDIVLRSSLTQERRTQALRVKLGLGSAGGEEWHMTLQHRSAGADATAEATEALRARMRAAESEEDDFAGCAKDLRMGELDTLLHDYRQLVLESARTSCGAAPGPSFGPIAPPVLRFFHLVDATSLVLRDVPALLQEYRTLLATATHPP
jgi:hypothetical protein